MVAGLIASGQIDAGIGCGVEAMSRVSLGAALAPGTGMPMPDDFTLDMPDQFTAAERIAAKYGITREAADHLGLVSQQRAAQEWAEARFDNILVPVTAPGKAKQEDGSRVDTGETRRGEG